MNGQHQSATAPVRPYEEDVRVSDVEVGALYPEALGHHREDAGLLTTTAMERLNEEHLEAQDTDGTDLLRRVFDSMATNDRITMDQLPFVLVGAEVQASAAEIDAAIEEHLPDADDAGALLDFEQVQCLFHQLIHNNEQVAVVPGGEAQLAAPTKLTPWARAKEWWSRRQHRANGQTAYEKQLKPTTRLLILILLVSCATCTAVVLFAVISIWNHSYDVELAHVKRDAQLMSEGIQMFGYQHPMEEYDTSCQRIATFLGQVVEDLGYRGTMELLQADLVDQQQLLAGLLDGWFVHDYSGMLGSLAALVKNWLEQMLAAWPEAEVLATTNLVNSQLPPGHEVVLTRWNATSQKILFLTQFRFKDQCLNNVCGSDPSAAAPSKAALAQLTGTMIGNDYRPQLVVAGYTWLPNSSIGLVYKVDLARFRSQFADPVGAVVAAINSNTVVNTASGTQKQQVLLAQNGTHGAVRALAPFRECDATCIQTADVSQRPVALALRQLSGVTEATSWLGHPIVTAYGPLPNAGLGMEVSVEKADVMATLFQGLGQALDSTNAQLGGSKEVQLAVIANSTEAQPPFPLLQFYTSFSFPRDCLTPNCTQAANTSVFLLTAIQQRATGVMHGYDYRERLVTAGYTYLPDLQAGLAMKIDQSEILAEGLAMSVTIAVYENNVRYAGSSTEVVVSQKKPGVTVVRSARDIQLVTPRKFACPNGTCVGQATHSIIALEQAPGIITGRTALDYRNVETIGGSAHLEELNVGIVWKTDESEAMAGAVHLTLELVACTVGAVVVSMLVLALLANVLLKSMDHQWAEGKKAIEHQKQQFCDVITAMYPGQVAKRMLAGETKIVYNVPNATIFFSDIVEFTTTSNSITPEELIQFMGYTFGVMDNIADYHHVHKVKTIGDAFLAVSGLPGMEILSENATLDMMLFASCCNQVFSSRFHHPETGAILDKVVVTVLHKKGAKARGNDVAEATQRPAQIQYGGGGGDSPAAVAPERSGEADELPVHCIMRYGLAAGPIAAGVLPGKTPLFDIWGKCVNLASRMESTGRPGRIQVAESVYKAIIPLKGQPFTFEPRRKVFCKGFGQVNTYFVDYCTVAPPKALLNALGIEPNLGNFFFDNPVPGYRLAGKTYSGDKQSSENSKSDQKSEASSSGPRASAAL